jgi:signal transduction histidine kinase
MAVNAHEGDDRVTRAYPRNGDHPVRAAEPGTPAGPILDAVFTRFAYWFEERPVAGDACLAGLLLLVFVLPSDLASHDDPLVDLAFSTALVACVPLRRRAPVAVFAAVCVLCLAQLAALDHIVAGNVVALIALYTVVAYGPGTGIAVAATACAVVGAVLVAARWSESTDDVSLLGIAVSTVVSVLLAATLGAWRRSRRAEVVALRERNRLLALERDQQAARERARIAREMHDVVAHSLSVIVVQADGAAAGAEQRPEQAAAALRTIGDTGREALAQMRRLLGVLRAGEGENLAPQPGTAQLEALVDQVASAGVPARLSVEGAPRPLAATLDLTVYRVIQEGLTNVLKHAGKVSRVDVVLRYRDDAVELLLRDDGRGGRAASDGRGQGLAGMRERVGVHDGTLEAGPREGGGFEVHAVLPT